MSHKIVDRRRFLKTLTSLTVLTLSVQPLTGSGVDGKKGKTFERKSKATLTPFCLNHNDTLRFILRNGQTWEMTLLKTSAEITQRNNKGITAYAFDCDLQINGKPHHLRREVGTQASFYEPWKIDGVHIWFDAASCAFKEGGGFMLEKDWALGFVCKPNQKARFAVQEADMPVCPEPLKLWYPNDAGRLDIHDCYNGEDCWMGPYGGKAAHCGLDVNMKAGTTLFAPMSFDNHYLFHSTEANFENNRWRGTRRWPDGSEWWLQSHHLIRMLVPERTPLKAGTPYATTAGVYVGSHDHTHFMFRVLDQGGEYWLDPWILFWEMFRQGKKGK
ncbi:MAG: hypothetical protein PHR77_20065 [Kiritimatiellae bacterium]|nr:hypothetical protein [Kiritimatiellia bacterium]MDD5522775.1 hypothetical protein [Kiritimatiellia bacterium]